MQLPNNDKRSREISRERLFQIIPIQQQKAELIEVQHDNGDDCAPDTGEPYDFDDLLIEIYIDVPEDWE